MLSEDILEMNRENEIDIIGCGGHARSVADVLLDMEPDCKITFWDDNAKLNEKIYLHDRKFDVFNYKDLKNSDKIFVAIGDNRIRNKISNERRIESKNIISQHAYVSRSAMMSTGNFIGNGAYVGPQVKIGNGNIINTHAVVEHESVIGDFCHISVNSTVCGRCKIGSNVFIGAGATVIDKITICNNVIVGANCVVTRDIAEPGVYVGCPVQRIEDRKGE